MFSKALVFIAASAVSAACLAAEFVPSDAPPGIKAAIDKAEDLNDKCRGGSGDNPKTMGLCDQRDKAYTEIKKQGWCFGDSSKNEIEANKTWQKCATNSPPRYDAKAYCRKLSAIGGSPSEILYGSCLEQEQDSYDGLKASWASIPDGIKKYCDRLARVSSPGSYIMLSECVRQEISAKKANSKADFNY